MIDIRPFASLGHADHGWLDAHHHFSFASYLDPSRMGWGRIRVWNDDRIAARSGFPPHPHRDMEIVTYVRTGAMNASAAARPPNALTIMRRTAVTSPTSMVS